MTTMKERKDSQPGQPNMPEEYHSRTQKSVTIHKPREAVYRFWREIENLPSFMRYLKSVTDLGNGRSHWVAEDDEGQTLEWDAEIISDRPNELIVWRSLDKKIEHTGSVSFSDAPGQRGTELSLVVAYNTPYEKAGKMIAKFLGRDPSEQIDEDVRRFKQLLETGEIARSEKNAKDGSK